MRILRQSTEVDVIIGPLVDATDGTTLEASVSFGSSDLALHKHEAAAVVDISGNTVSATLGAGLYLVTLTTTDTNTLGLLSVVAYDSAHRPIRHDFVVVPANVYDSLILGTDYLDINATQIAGNAASGYVNSTTALYADVKKLNGDATAAAQLAKSTVSIADGTVQTGSTTVSIKTNLTETQNDHYNGRILIFTSGAQKDVAQTINDYDGASKTLTITAAPAAPSNGDTFVIV